MSFQYQLNTQIAGEQYHVSAVQTLFTASRAFCSDIIASYIDANVYDFVRHRRGTAEINTLRSSGVARQHGIPASATDDGDEDGNDCRDAITGLNRTDRPSDGIYCVTVSRA